MRSINSLRAATAAVGLVGMAAMGFAQTSPTPSYTADGATLSGHATGPVLDVRVSPDGNFVATVVAVAANPGGAELRVRNAATGAFLWSANLGPLPEVGLPRVAFTPNSTRLLFVQTVGVNESLVQANPTTGAAISTFNNIDRDFFRSRVVVSADGLNYAFQGGDNRSGATRRRILVRTIAANAVVNEFVVAPGGVNTDIRDFNFTPDGTEVVVAPNTSNTFRVNLGTGLETSLGFAGNTVNRIERIPGSTTDLMFGRTTVLERRALAAGALVRSYTNIPAGAINSISFFATNTTTNEAYVVGAVGAFDFATFVRVDNGDRVAQYDLRRTGEAASDSRMNGLGFTTLANAGVVFGSNGATSPATRVIRTEAPFYRITIAPTAVVGGATAVGTVTLPGPAPVGGFTVPLSSNNANAVVPASVTVLAGSTTANFNITTVTVSSNQAPTISATFPSSTLTAGFTIVRAIVSNLSLSGNSGQTGFNPVGTVTLNGNVTADTTVALSYSNAAQFTAPPATVTVLAGSNTANFNLTTAEAGNDQLGNVTATLNGTNDVEAFTLVGVRVSDITYSASPIRETETQTATIVLNTTTDFDRTVALAYPLGPLTTPTSVVVPAGQSSVEVEYTIPTAESPVIVNIEANLFSLPFTNGFDIRPTQISALNVTPDPVNNSTNAVGVVTLEAAAPTDRVVNLTYTPAANFDTAPATVTVLAGQTSANFVFKSKVIDAGFTGANISGALGGVSASDTFDVKAVQLRGVEMYPYNARSGDRVVGVVRLASPVAADTTFTIVSGSPTLIANQSVTVLAGNTYGTFWTTLGTATARTTVNLNSTYPGGEVRNSRFYVQPAANVIASGRGQEGQLGDGVRVDQNYSIPTNLTANILKVTATDAVTYYLRNDGRILANGTGTQGELGSGANGTVLLPFLVANVLTGKDVAAGANHALAIDASFKLWGWGRNAENQLGIAGGQRNAPTSISTVLAPLKVSAGDTHSVMFNTNGDIYVWGTGPDGQLGLGATTNATVPTFLSIGGPCVWISAGKSHTLAIRADGKVFGWGRNIEGQLGLGDFVNRNVPTEITSLPKEVISAEAGGNTSAFLRVPAFFGNTQIFTTGQGTSGQLGSGANVNRNTLFTLNTPTDAIELAVGDAHTLIGRANQTVQATGQNTSGQLALGSFTNRNTFATASALFNTTALGVGNRASYGIRFAPVTVLRDDLLFFDPVALTVGSRDTVTGTITNFTGTYAANLTPIGGYNITGSSAPEVIFYDAVTREVFASSPTATALGTPVLQPVTIPAGEALVSMGDFNGDSRADYITFNSGTGQVMAYYWNGTAISSSALLVTLAANEVVQGTGDFNGDQRTDILVRNTVTRALTVKRFSLSIFQGTNTFNLSSGGVVNPSSIYTVIGGGEIQLFNSLEMVLRNNTTGNLERWDLSRLTVYTTGGVIGAAPVGKSFLNFWR